MKVEQNEISLKAQTEIRKVLTPHGLKYFLLAYSPTMGNPGLKGNLISSNWPEPLFAACDKANLLSSVTSTVHMRRKFAPRQIDMQAFLGLDRQSLDSELVGAFEHLLKVIVFHMRDMEGTGYLLFVNRVLEVDETSLGILTLGLMRAVETISTSKQPKVRLSAREIDCLRWSAAGKSSDAIGVILNLSEYTVNGYLKTAIRKLNAVNRTQAVAKACKLEII
jgi:DNA-binding CsgD family transcriptional regulator